MSAAGTPYKSQARLWLLAFAASALVNALALGGIGFWVLASIALRPPSRPVSAPETIAMIVPRLADEAPPADVPVAAVPPADNGAKPFVRTSPDQVEAVPAKAEFIGERNTRATSELAPQPEAPEMPRQKGREPFSEGEIETTASDYQDGELESPQPVLPAEAATPAPPAAAGEPMQPAETLPAPDPAHDTLSSAPKPEAAKERLAEGPLPVDRRVSVAEVEQTPKPAPPQRQAEGEAMREEQQTGEEQPKPAPPAPAPAFRGNQSKTRLEGSIARVGRSALNVEDSALGRYHATVSRAVEKAWQINCVRNRDYITPGQLTLRVMLEASGKVRSMGVVEEIGVGNIQKGFTLNSIRDAEIPSMPATLKKQLDGEPLELIYRFNF